jgi:hypothetical protein
MKLYNNRKRILKRILKMILKRILKILKKILKRFLKRSLKFTFNGFFVYRLIKKYDFLDHNKKHILKMNGY